MRYSLSNTIILYLIMKKLGHKEKNSLFRVKELVSKESRYKQMHFDFLNTMQILREINFI